MARRTPRQSTLKVLAFSIVMASAAVLVTHTAEAFPVWLAASALLASNLRRAKGRREPSEDIVTFLTIFSSELEGAKSREGALIGAVSKTQARSPEYAELAEQVCNGVSVERSLASVFEREKRWGEARCLIPLQLLKKDSAYAGRILGKRVQSYQEFARLARERNEILRVLSFRTKIMIVAFSLSLSILTTMIPFAAMLFTGLKPIENLSSQLNELSVLQSFVVAVTTYMAGKSSGMRRTLATAAAAVALYWVGFSVFSTQMLVFKY